MPPAANDFQRKQDSSDATIADAGSLSTAIPLFGAWPVGVMVPTSWTAADITFAVSYDNGATYVPLYSQSAEVKIASAIIATAEARYFALDPTLFHGATHVKIRSGINGTVVAQSGAITLTLIRAFRLS